MDSRPPLTYIIVRTASMAIREQETATAVASVALRGAEGGGGGGDGAGGGEALGAAFVSAGPVAELRPVRWNRQAPTMIDILRIVNYNGAHTPSWLEYYTNLSIDAQKRYAWNRQEEPTRVFYFQTEFDLQWIRAYLENVQKEQPDPDWCKGLAGTFSAPLERLGGALVVTGSTLRAREPETDLWVLVVTWHSLLRLWVLKETREFIKRQTEIDLLHLVQWNVPPPAPIHAPNDTAERTNCSTAKTSSDQALATDPSINSNLNHKIVN